MTLQQWLDTFGATVGRPIAREFNRCAVCGEAANEVPYSMAGTMHKYGPVSDHDYTPQNPPTMVIPDFAGDETVRAKLWRLDDYRVSSVSGGSIWLTPRK